MEGRDLDALYLAHTAEIARRSEALLAEHGWDALAIHSGSLVPRSRYDDQFWPLRVCPHFAYWAPLGEAECLLLVRPGRKPVLFRPAARSFWERPAPPESDAFAEAMDLVPYRDPDDGRAALAERAPGRVAFVGEEGARAGRWGIPEAAACPPALVAGLDALRTRKTAYEVACVAEANRRARAGHEALREAFRAGSFSELDLHLKYLSATRQDDAETPYKNIVALGSHAATLHHVAYGREASGRAAESLLVDAGATCRGYASDVTRTWVRGSGAAARAFAHLVAGVDGMQRRLCGAVRAGAPFEALHDESHRLAAEVLREVGVVSASADEAVGRGLTRAFYPHGLGHSLGLQTHDVGCGLRAPRPENPFLRNTSDVTPGQIVTIEPGIYLIEELLAPLRADATLRALVRWDLVDALAPLGGVRVEDDVVVLGDGIRNLTREVLPAGGGRVD